MGPVLISQDEKEINIVNVDHINKGPYILESLKIDKNNNKTEALNDIYKLLRPGEAPSTEIAEEMMYRTAKTQVKMNE